MCKERELLVLGLKYFLLSFASKKKMTYFCALILERKKKVPHSPIFIDDYYDIHNLLYFALFCAIFCFLLFSSLLLQRKEKVFKYCQQVHLFQLYNTALLVQVELPLCFCMSIFVSLMFSHNFSSKHWQRWLIIN